MCVWDESEVFCQFNWTRIMGIARACRTVNGARVPPNCGLTNVTINSNQRVSNLVICCLGQSFYYIVYNIYSTRTRNKIHRIKLIPSINLKQKVISIQFRNQRICSNQTTFKPLSITIKALHLPYSPTAALLPSSNYYT